jgi:flavin reductase (DIM6/NTAB) family NADH-FMN oxidoreductase RutF
MFSSNVLPNSKRKDTVINVEETKHFVWNLATWDLREAVNITGEQVSSDVDEFEKASQYISKEPATLIDVPMVKESPVKFECEYHSTTRLPGNPPMGTVDIVIGKVIAVHIKDEVMTDGILDVKKTLPIARCGYLQYTVIRDTFDMIIPGDNELMRLGMEGNAKHIQQHGQQEEKTEA